jgi:hypothetical protein
LLLPQFDRWLQSSWSSHFTDFIIAGGGRSMLPPSLRTNVVVTKICLYVTFSIKSGQKLPAYWLPVKDIKTYKFSLFCFLRKENRLMRSSVLSVCLPVTQFQVIWGIWPICTKFCTSTVLFRPLHGYTH